VLTRARGAAIENSILANLALGIVQTNQAPAQLAAAQVPAQQAAPQPPPQALPVPAPNMAAPAAPAAPFAFTPAIANHNLLDYTTSEGKKLWREASEKLPIGEFDGKNPHTLLRDLDQRAMTQDWRTILTVTVGGTDYYLPRQYGAVTMAQVRAHATVYMVTTQDRRTQNSCAMAECLYKSLDSTLRMKVTNSPDLYEFPAGARRVADGPLLLMAILSHCTVRTKSSATNVRIQLTQLGEYMNSTMMTSGDITSLNNYVRSLVNQLTSLTENMDENNLVIHLFNGYKASPDQNFRNFMAGKHERIMYFNDPERSPEEIMQVAEQYYTDRVSQGEWAKPSGDQQSLITLQAQFKNFSANKNKKDSKGKQKNEKKGKKDKKDNKKKDGKNFSYEAGASWKWKAPAAGESKTKTIKDIQYFWCPNHQHQTTKAWGMWTRHKLSECKAHAPSSSSQGSSNSNSQAPHSYHALNSIIEGATEGDDDYDYN
jgi:hypothetical protein